MIVVSGLLIVTRSRRPRKSLFTYRLAHFSNDHWSLIRDPWWNSSQSQITSEYNRLHQNTRLPQLNKISTSQKWVNNAQTHGLTMKPKDTAVQKATQSGHIQWQCTKISLAGGSLRRNEKLRICATSCRAQKSNCSCSKGGRSRYHRHVVIAFFCVEKGKACLSPRGERRFFLHKYYFCKTKLETQQISKVRQLGEHPPFLDGSF